MLYSATQETVRQVMREGGNVYFRCDTAHASWPKFLSDAAAHVRAHKAGHVELGPNYARATTGEYVGHAIVPAKPSKEEWIGTEAPGCIIEIYDDAPGDLVASEAWTGPRPPEEV